MYSRLRLFVKKFSDWHWCENGSNKVFKRKSSVISLFWLLWSCSVFQTLHKQLSFSSILFNFSGRYYAKGFYYQNCQNLHLDEVRYFPSWPTYIFSLLVFSGWQLSWLHFSRKSAFLAPAMLVLYFATTQSSPDAQGFYFPYYIPSTQT